MSDPCQRIRTIKQSIVGAFKWSHRLRSLTSHRSRTPDKTCKVVETRPTDKTIVVIGDKAYVTKDEAEKQGRLQRLTHRKPRLTSGVFSIVARLIRPVRQVPSILACHSVHARVIPSLYRPKNPLHVAAPTSTDLL